MFRLQGKRAVVTGAASGIGLAVAEILAAAGAEVLLLDLDSRKAQAAAMVLPGAVGIGCDVGSEESVMAAFRSMDEPLHLLVNCAGIAHVGSLETTSTDDLDRLFRVNVRGTYLCMREGVKAMLRSGGGAIVNMASIAATSGISDRFAYSMTKGAVLSMTLSVAKDYLDRGIRCNCVSPARVHTPFVDGFLAANYPGQEAEKLAALARAQPIGRMGTPAEIAALVLYLCSDEASFVSGVDYPIDGGFGTLR